MDDTCSEKTSAEYSHGLYQMGGGNNRNILPTAKEWIWGGSVQLLTLQDLWTHSQHILSCGPRAPPGFRAHKSPSTAGEAMNVLRALEKTASATRIFLLLFRERSCQSHLSQEGPASLEKQILWGRKDMGTQRLPWFPRNVSTLQLLLEASLFPPLKGKHAEFASQLMNYAVLTLATVSLSLCKHEAVQNGKGWERLAARTQWRLVSSSLNLGWCSCQH